MAILVTLCEVCGGPMEFSQCKGHEDSYDCKRCGHTMIQYDDTCGGR